MSVDAAPTSESCGMPMETVADHAPGHPESAYCGDCSTPDGDLQPFEQRFEVMTGWEMRQHKTTRADAETATRAYMRQMPAWRDNPALHD